MLPGKSLTLLDVEVPGAGVADGDPLAQLGRLAVQLRAARRPRLRARQQPVLRQAVQKTSGNETT